MVFWGGTTCFKIIALFQHNKEYYDGFLGKRVFNLLRGVNQGSGLLLARRGSQWPWLTPWRRLNTLLGPLGPLKQIPKRIVVPSLCLLWAQGLAILPSNLVHFKQNKPD